MYEYGWLLRNPVSEAAGRSPGVLTRNFAMDAAITGAVVATIRPSREERTRAPRDSGDKHQESGRNGVCLPIPANTVGLECPA